MTERILDGADLLASLDAAQQALTQASPGSRETWILPPGEHQFVQGLVLGAPQCSLCIRGRRSAEAKTTLVFTGNGAIDGDLVALELRGTHLCLDEVAVRARAVGGLTGIRARDAGKIHFSDVSLQHLRAEAVVGVDLQGEAVDLIDIVVSDIRAAAGNAVGLRLEAAHIGVSRVHVERVRGRDLARGMQALAGGALAAAMIRVENIQGMVAEGLYARVSDLGGKLAVLDLHSRRINAADEADGAQSIGSTLACAGDVEIRSLSAHDIRGAAATGVRVAAAGRIDWLAGDIGDIRGMSAGAAGVRIFASPSTRPVWVKDLQVEAVRAALNGTQARPSASWSAWAEAAASALQNGEALPQWPPSQHPEHEEDVVGIHVGARVTEFETWIDSSDPGPVCVEQCVLRRVSGTALQVEGDMRDVEIRGVEAWTTVRGGWVDGERVLMAQLTWHRHASGISLGPCGLTLANSLITGIDQGPALVWSPQDTDLTAVVATYASRAQHPLLNEPQPLPYVDPGPASPIPPSMLNGALAPQAAVDLRLLPAHPLHAEAERVPGDASGETPFLGAHAPDTDSRCDLRDPLPPTPAQPQAAVEPSPVVDYRARDARSLMALMTARARMVMPDWTEAYPSDMTTMLLELLAHRMDHLAYRQEAAVAEGFLGTALTRRAVVDHARLVDDEADEGLSATAMLRFHIDEAGIDALGLRERYAFGQRLVIPQDTLVVNPDARDTAVIFSTEAQLALDYFLSELALHEDIQPRANAAELLGDLTSLEVGRWLIFKACDQQTPAHVVRVTRVELGTDTTRVFWDPRRPAPARYAAETTVVFGNVIPAHHGVPLTPDTSPDLQTTSDLRQMLQPWREQMHLHIDNHGGDIREVELPLDPVSRRAQGWPFPGESLRRGAPDLKVQVNAETWDRVADLCLQGPGDESYVLRPGRGGGAAIRFGDGRNGAALPRGPLGIDLSMRVGLGDVGNVGPDALTRILAFGPGFEMDAILPAGAPDRRERIQRHLRVTNPIGATGGRDPEPLERIRYRAPRKVRETLSAVVPKDYERLLESLAEVAAARARVVDVGIRRVVRVIALLKDEDLLTGTAADPDRDAERLRRWALVRRHLESIRLLGFDVELLPPRFIPLDIDVIVDAQPWVQADQLALRVQEALAGSGGLFDPDNTGLGGDVHVDAIHHAVLRVDGVAAVRVGRLRRLAPGAVEYAGLGALPIAGDEVAVIRHPYGHAAEDGLLTVSVCGGLS